MSKKVAIFDMDGTLVDSSFQWGCTSAVTLFHFGKLMTDEESREVQRLGFFKAPGYLIERYGLPCTEKEFLEKGYAIMEEQYRNFIVMRPNARQYLESLHEKGIRCVILTASRGVFADIMIKKFQLEGLIDAVYSAHDLKLEKSQPAIYHKLFEEMGCMAEECYMFEDSAYALNTAKALGIEGVGVKDPVRPRQHAALEEVALRCVGSYEELLENDVFA